jgi:predicted MFS family arabinose efflux permease
MNDKKVMDKKLLWLLTVTTVLTVGNVYYSQPLLGEMGVFFNRPPAEVGSIPTLTQLGYVTGLLLLTPLGDVLEKRKLLVVLFFLSAISLLGAGLSPNFYVFLGFSFAIGATAVLVQILLPFVALMSAREERGKNLGMVLSGALIGVLLSRTLSGFIAGYLGWRGVYYIAAGIMLLLAAVLSKTLPEHHSAQKIKYHQLIHSVWHLFKTIPEIRAISITGALMYASLSAFWVSLTFLLHSPEFNLGPFAAGLFGLVGAMSALSANITGRHAERIGAKKIVLICIGMMTLAFIVMGFSYHSIIGLIVGTILLDIGAQTATVSNQTQIYTLHSEAQTRINTIYKICYFLGGAVGSLLSSVAWQHFGWMGVTGIGITLLVLAFFWTKFHKVREISHV